MKFNVNTTEFQGEVDLSNHVEIKSYNKIYNVIYCHNELEEIIRENYEENDFIIIDKNVYNIYSNSLATIPIKFIKFLNAIEENKNIYSVLEIVDLLNELKFNKKNKLIIIGGGITQDVGGFASAIFKRGLKWVLIPTTLLSITDSCIGGKVGVNRNSKNLLSLFNAPNKVIISDIFLKTLQDDDIISGLGESLKLSLIGGEETYQIFKNNSMNNDYMTIIKMSSSVKKLIIEKDELEKDERRVLNYGHTFGHALESTSNYFIPHGIGVLFGMYMINKLFYDDKYAEIDNYIMGIIPKKFKKIELSYDEFICHILDDKKNNGDTICFILLDDIGNSIFRYKKLVEIDEKLKTIFNILFDSVV
jgi:3-dehydroquinate synthase